MNRNATAIRLLPHLDASRVQDEFLALGGERFRPQASFIEGDIIENEYAGWRVLSLRSPGGSATRADAGGPGLVGYADTPFMAEVAYLSAELKGLGLDYRAIRFMSLEPGASVGEHTDYPYGLAVGWARLHLPVVTNPQAVIVIDGDEHRWQPGELWYGDFGRPHHLYNNGEEARVHLVIDCFCDDALLRLLPSDAVAQLAGDGLMMRRPVVPLTAQQLQDYVGAVVVPAAWLKAYAVPPTPDEFADSEDLAGDVRLRDGTLVLTVGNDHEAALEHLGDGEFRQLCWTEERTIRFQRSGEGVGWGYRHGSYKIEAHRMRASA